MAPLRMTADPLKRLRQSHKTLSDLGIPHGLIRVTPARDSDVVIDVILATGLADRVALSRCVEVELGEGSLPAVRREDIIAMKLQAGGGIDIEDARALLRVHADRLDEEILSEACRTRRVGALLERIRSQGV